MLFLKRWDLLNIGQISGRLYKVEVIYKQLLGTTCFGG